MGETTSWEIRIQAPRRGNEARGHDVTCSGEIGPEAVF